MYLRSILLVAICTLFSCSEDYTRVLVPSEDDFISIPDKEFELALIQQGIDTQNDVIDGRMLKEDAERVESMGLRDGDYTDLTGLEYFINLRNFNFEGDLVTNIDLSQNNALLYASISGDGLQSLNVKGNTNLIVLRIYSSSLARIDLNGLNLRTLTLHKLPLSALDLSSQNELDELSLDGVDSRLIEISSLPTTLKMLGLMNMGLETVELNQFRSLETLRLDGNQLTTLRLENMVNLEEVWAQSNRLGEFQINDCPEIKSLYLFGNQLSEIQLTSLKKLEYLNMGNNPLFALDLSKNDALTFLSIRENSMDYLNISNNKSLRTLWISNTSISNVNLSSNSQLRDVRLNGNLLDRLSVSDLDSLEILQVRSNRLSRLDVSNNSKLNSLWVRSNPSLSCIKIAKSQRINDFQSDSHQFLSADCR